MLDITTQVMIDQLMEAVHGLSVIPQAEWLQTWGINELVSEGTKYWEEYKSVPDIAAIKMRSRLNELGALTKMSKLGSFTAIFLNIVDHS